MKAHALRSMSDLPALGEVVTWSTLSIVGALMITALAQISIPLPFTPVPLTGQTFGVYLLSLLLGRRAAVGSVGVYLGVGFAGIPVFAHTAFSGIFGPTLGYLIGMLGAAWVVGGLADRGKARTMLQALGAALIGSLVIFSCGLAGLAFFVPKNALLLLGLYPFLPGDVVKLLLAALITTRSVRK